MNFVIAMRQKFLRRFVIRKYLRKIILSLHNLEDKKMNAKILKLLESNARMSSADIATALVLNEDEVRREISNMEKTGVIRGYKCIIDRERTADMAVNAIIELKVVPKVGLGFEEVAERIAKYPNVVDVSLVSGACDLMVTVRCKTLAEVSSFVAKELATIEGVSSTSTQFIMRKYKELGIELFGDEVDERSKILL